jgi:hypothetical protein
MTDRIAGEVMVYQAITILEIDDSGMRIEAAFPLQNDSLREFRLVLGARSIVVKGRVERCEVGELTQGGVLYRCRVEFVDPASHVANTIRVFVAVHNAPTARVVDGEVTNT